MRRKKEEIVAYRLGTRASKLAVAQAGMIAEQIGADLVTITSEGDVSTASLSTLGGRGVFANALRDALLADEVDVLVHSYKDLPTAVIEGLAISAVPPRADARDVLCSRDGLSLQDLPAGAKVGTGSPRRRAQVARVRPDVELVDIRGNVDTRLERLTTDDPERRLDAVILAAAGLQRVGYADRITQYLELSEWPTAPAQGALAVEVRTGSESIASALDHADTRLAADAERGVLARLDAGCAAPLGAHAFVQDGLLFLDAAVYSLDGTQSVSASHAVAADEPGAADIAAAAVSDSLLAQGAADLAPMRRESPTKEA